MTSEWEQSLGSLLSPEPDIGGAPLGIELTLATEPLLSRVRGPAPGPTIFAKVVRQGRNGWVAGGLSWGKLGPYGYEGAHVRLLQQMYALYQAQESVYYRDDRMIDLSRFDSRHLWTFLDEAREIGVRLVHARKRLGTIDDYGSARICLDARSADDLVVQPYVQVEGVPDPVPLRFIGDGHGLVYVSRAELDAAGDHEDCRIGLARLAKQAPEPLRDMVIADRRLVIPDRERPRFLDRYYPKLRHMADIVSSDGSFTPPAISGPTLVLNASYQPDHDLELTWEWTYQVGEKRMRASLDAEPEAYRDLAGESAILAGLTVEPEDRKLQGVETMHFTTEVLPLLGQQVEIDVSGEPAHYREAGDSVRIGLSATGIPGQTDWFDLGVSITVDGRTIPFMEVFLALSKDKPYLLLPDGAYFSLRKPQLRALHDLIIEARALLDQPAEGLRISRFQAGLWDELVNLGVVEHQAREWRRQVHGLLTLEEAEQVDLPEMVEAQLRPYQLTGFRWLTFLWENKLGGVLADDMGLGKTLQTLAMICHTRATTDAPFLVVAPTSVVANWASESARFTPGLKVVSISDTVRRGRQDIGAIAAGADIVVTSYTLLRLDFQAYANLPWAGLVLDEAQVVKNHQSKVHQCARRLPAPFKLAITGTPMENNLMELWSLLSITAPGLFPDPVRFQQYYARRIERTGDPGLLAQLRSRVRPLIRRRTKDQVASDLPAKQEQLLEVELHPRHRKVYQTHLQRERQRVLGMVDDMNKNRFTIFRSLTKLRQLSLHPGLLEEQYRDLPCAKVDALLEQLRDVVEGGHRALVFSQFTSFLAIVRAQLDAAGIPYSYLDGSTSDRGKVVTAFKDGAAPVFLISLKAGGFGLNLTEADYCFLLDPWWNPATEAQAVDRTHRIGQSRNVMVYRLIARDTIEEKVMALKAKKAALFASVMDDGAMFGSALDADDIRMLFG
ncbi:MAG: SNF2-related protein [Kibdelosporangium sp.]